MWIVIRGLDPRISAMEVCAENVTSFCAKAKAEVAESRRRRSARNTQCNIWNK
jgi:hypothetical protein